MMITAIIMAGLVLMTLIGVGFDFMNKSMNRGNVSQEMEAKIADLEKRVAKLESGK